MGMEARLTLSGMLAFDNTLFDNMVLPSPPVAADIGMESEQIRAAWTIDKITLINYISMVTASQSLVFPNADYMKMAIHTWSTMHLPTWQSLFNTWFYRYNPLWNKDGKFSTTSADTRIGSGTANTTGTVTNDAENTHYTHGYDGNTVVDEQGLNWTHAEKDVSTSSNTTDDLENSYNNRDENRHTETRTEQGNIGITTTQQMIKEERENAMFNLYDVIAESFKKFFCIAIY